MISSAIAEPCVGPRYDVPFPGAINVETLQVDVPSAQFPGLWQQGLIDGYAYQIFANRTGVLREAQSPSAWSIAEDCQETLCIRQVFGSPPSLAWDISKRIERCIRAPVTAKPAAVSEPIAVAAPAEPAIAEPAASVPTASEPESTQQIKAETAAAERSQPVELTFSRIEALEPKLQFPAHLRDVPHYRFGPTTPTAKASVEPQYCGLDFYLRTASHLGFGLPAVVTSSIK